MHFLIMFNSNMTTCYVILVLGWVQADMYLGFRLCVILLVVETGVIIVRCYTFLLLLNLSGVQSSFEQTLGWY
jgi:hypothetical protein